MTFIWLIFLYYYGYNILKKKYQWKVRHIAILSLISDYYIRKRQMFKNIFYDTTHIHTEIKMLYIMGHGLIFYIIRLKKHRCNCYVVWENLYDVQL